MSNDEIAKSIVQQVEMLNDALPQVYEERLRPFLDGEGDRVAHIASHLYREKQRVRFLLDHLESVLDFERLLLQRKVDDVDERIGQLKAAGENAKSEFADALVRNPLVDFPQVVKRLDVRRVGKGFVFSLPPLVRAYYDHWTRCEFPESLSKLRARGQTEAAEEFYSRAADFGYCFSLEADTERLKSEVGAEWKGIRELLEQPFPELPYSPTVHSALGRDKVFSTLFSQIRATSMQTVMPLTVMGGVITAALAFGTGDAAGLTGDVKHGLGVAAGVLGLFGFGLAIVAWIQRNGEQRREALRVVNLALSAREKQINTLLGNQIGMVFGKIIDNATEDCLAIAAEQKDNLRREIADRAHAVKNVQDTDSRLARILGK